MAVYLEGVLFILSMKIQLALSKVLHANAFVGFIANKEMEPELVMLPTCKPAVLEINVFTLNFLGANGDGWVWFVLLVQYSRKS